MQPAPDTPIPPKQSQSGAGSKAATQFDYTGPYCTGPRMVQIVTSGADGRTLAVEYVPAADKAEAMAIAKRAGATFTA